MPVTVSLEVRVTDEQSGSIAMPAVTLRSEDAGDQRNTGSESLLPLGFIIPLDAEILASGIVIATDEFEIG
jgi:hypothetical protein